MKLTFLTACVLSLLSSLAYAELIFHPLKHQTPANIIPSIQPFLQSGETVIAAHNELILRIKPANIVELKALINKLDVASHRLRIYVNRDGRFQQQQEGYELNQQLHIGSGVKRSYQGSLKVYTSSKHSNDNKQQSIQVLDGHTAHISSGISRPSKNLQISQHANSLHISSTSEYIESSSGFYVTPRLSHGAVILEISPWYQRPLAGQANATEFSRVSSIIRGRLNSWIKLSGINEQGHLSSSRILGKHHQTAQKNHGIWLKVVDLDAE